MSGSLSNATSSTDSLVPLAALNTPMWEDMGGRLYLMMRCLITAGGSLCARTDDPAGINYLRRNSFNKNRKSIIFD
jgi:hypothetical protein